MVQINSINISPPLFNSSCVWSSDLAQLKVLFDSPFTGAITTRTATLNGFKENESHTFAFANATASSINSYGYSPYPFAQYLIWIKELLSNARAHKPIIVSITSDVDDPASLASMISQLQDLRRKIGDQGHDSKARIAIELNTSCPNIKDKPPPGYDFESLNPLLQVLFDAFTRDPTLTIGLKLPPLIHEQQFSSVLDGISSLNSSCPSRDTTPAASVCDAYSRSSVISFLTCTNTLGNSLLFTDQSLSFSAEQSKSSTDFALPTVLGGLAGEALHPLALGNVYRFSRSLKGLDKAWPSAWNIKIIGVGGITSKEAKERMVKAGADAITCATFLGREGVRAFEILDGN